MKKLSTYVIVSGKKRITNPKTKPLTVKTIT